jgi:hypothetical protein
MFNFEDGVGIVAFIKWSRGLTFHGTDHGNRRALREAGWIKKLFPNREESSFRPKTFFCQGAFLFSRQLQDFQFGSRFRPFSLNHVPTHHDCSSDILAGSSFEIGKADAGIDLLFQPKRYAE